MKRFAKRTKTKIDDVAIDALEEPLTFVPVALGVFVVAQMLGLSGAAEIGATNLIQTLIAVTIFWGFYRLVDPFFPIAQSQWKKSLTHTLIDWIRKSLKVFFVFLGIFAILSIWDIPVLPVLASFSLLSVAVALGAQDLFKNMIGGLLILAERRFKIGDWIMVDGVVEGTVAKINFRSHLGAPVR